MINENKEGIGDLVFNNEAIFSRTFVELLAEEVEFDNQESDYLDTYSLVTVHPPMSFPHVCSGNLFV